MQQPLANEYPTFYGKYVALVPQHDGIIALRESGRTIKNYLATISPAKATYRYAADKWSVNEVIQHIIDCEIIFLYRALRIARNDTTPLPGFEQDDYVPAALSDYQGTASLTDLFMKTRELSIALFASLPPHTQTNIGVANGNDISVRALCYIISGHALHHLHILKTRYQ